MGCDMVKLVFCPSHSPERPAGREQVEDAGSCYTTVVKHMPHNREGMGSNPPSAGLFYLLYPLNGVSLIKVPQGGADLPISNNMLSHEA